MFKRLKIKQLFAFLLVACLLAGGIAVCHGTAYAQPGNDPAATEQTTEGVDAEAGENAAQERTAPVPAATQGAGIMVNAAEEEDDVNPMDAILSVDRIILDVWGKICSRIAIVIGILLACVIGIVIYIMVTQTTKLSRQNKEMSHRPSRRVGVQSAVQMSQPQPQRQVKQFGDTLRIRRTVSDAGAPVQANMQRPVAPQRPSRPAQGTVQPGVRRPVQTQPVRPAQSQRPAQPAARTTQAQPQRPAANAQPRIRQPQRPAQGTGRPVQNIVRSAQSPQQRDQH